MEPHAQGLLHRFQGPALFAYNDAAFSEWDWEGIQSLQQSGKAKDPFKVGKFGIGFNSVYHITGEKYLLIQTACNDSVIQVTCVNLHDSVTWVTMYFYFGVMAFVLQYMFVCVL